MKRGAFFPDSGSPAIFVAMLVCYTWTATSVMQSIVRAVSPPPARTGWFVTPHTFSQWGADWIQGAILAPVFESMLLIGIIEILRVMRCSKPIQVVFAAVPMALLHVSPWPFRTLLVAPAFVIWAAAYLHWKKVTVHTWKAYAVVAFAHAFNNLIPASYELANLVQHRRSY